MTKIYVRLAEELGLDDVPGSDALLRSTLTRREALYLSLAAAGFRRAFGRPVCEVIEALLPPVSRTIESAMVWAAGATPREGAWT